jgi:hypothetical protein
MTFAGTAARGSAIPTPVEGMLTYLADTDTYQSWTGSTWIGITDPSIPRSVITAQGDLIVGASAGSASRIAIGANQTFLQSNGTTASWQPLTVEAAAGNSYMIIGTKTLPIANSGLYQSAIGSGTPELGYLSVGDTNTFSGQFPYSWLETFSNPSCITFGNGLFLVGQRNASLNETYIGVSSDLVNFTNRNVIAAGNVIKSMTFGNGVYVVGCNAGFLQTSTDTITWTTRTSGFGTTNINAVRFGANVYVAAGNAGTLTSSTNGTTWTARTSGFGTSAIWSLTFGNGIYVAVGQGGTIRTSTDAITWTSRTSNTTATLRSVAYGAGVFVAIAQTSYVSSTDGITWTLSGTNPAFNNELNDVLISVTYPEGSFIAAAANDLKTFGAGLLTLGYYGNISTVA